MSESTTAINDQILESVRAVQEALLSLDVSKDASSAIALQMITQSISLAMLNVVAQQQQLYTLRNAATTAAVRAILEAKPEEALDLAEKAFAGEDLVETLSRLQELMASAQKTFGGDAPTAAESTSAGPGEAARSKATRGTKKGAKTTDPS